MSTADFRIRKAVTTDGPALLGMVADLMQHMGDSPDDFDAKRFLDDAFGADPQFEVLMAEQAGIPVGYALFHDAYETAFAARGVYLSDIFVAASMRRSGLGRALLAVVADAARARGRTFVWWVARGDDARAFYRTLSLVEAQATAHALTFDAFERLADEGAARLSR